MYEYEEDYEEYEPPIPRRRATVGHDVSYHDKKTEVLPVAQPRFVRRRRRRIYPFFLLGACIVLASYLVWIIWIVPTYTAVEDQWHYGDARVFLTGADVGHGGFSRFIADDNQGEIIVVEIVGKKYIAYTAETLQGSGVDHRIVTLEIQDVNHDGMPDVIVHVEGVSLDLILYNTGKAFSWTGK